MCNMFSNYIYMHDREELQQTKIHQIIFDDGQNLVCMLKKNKFCLGSHLIECGVTRNLGLTRRWWLLWLSEVIFGLKTTWSR